MSAKAGLSVLFTVVLSWSTAWAFPQDQGHGSGQPLPEPQIGNFRQRNCDNLDRLKVGMSRENVSEVMGDRQDVQTYNLREKAEIISNPVRLDTRAGNGGEVREIRYYFAYQKKADLKITTDELCPLVFDDGVLAGWGWAYYEKEVGPVPADP